MRKLFSLLLILALLFSSFSVSFAETNINETTKVLEAIKSNLLKSNAIQKDPDAAGLKDSDKVRIIVELYDRPVIEYATEQGVRLNQLNNSFVETISDEILDTQELVKKEIAKQKIEIEYHGSFVNVVNGFSATTTLENAKKIEKLPNVKRVEIANRYERPTPNIESSKDIVFTKGTWALGYKGEGTVISIIDTGIDYRHKDMQLTDPNKAKLDQEEVNTVIENNDLPGQFLTLKVPYGYNYRDEDQKVIDESGSMHGMHVAGIVGANGDESDGGITGIAPEAQLLAMKVFSNDPSDPYAYEDDIVEAIDDSITLGADVINMSLGATAGFVSPDDPEQQAIKRATDNGVIVVVSGGNSAYFGNGHDLPFTENPDYGVVGSPGVARESIQVASLENTHVRYPALTYEGGTIAYNSAGPDPTNIFTDPVEYVYVNQGLTDADYSGVDVKGKIALIIRGGGTFVDKIKTAQDRGAVGVIVFNNKSGGDTYVKMAYPEDGTIPAVFITHTDGNKLVELIAQNKNYVEFTGETKIVSNPASGTMSTFSSWGVTPNFDLKPEITAPGGQIYSTVNDDKYEVMSGTSMAAPHVAGGSALILERINKDFNGISANEKVILAKNLLMSTADPLKDQGYYNKYYKLSNFTSPRQQGAGVMNLFEAATTPAIVTDNTVTNDTYGLSKVNLKEIGDTVTFYISVTNFSSETIAYEVYGNVQTDLVSSGYNLLESQAVYKDSSSKEYPLKIYRDDNTVVDSVYRTVYVGAYSSEELRLELDLTNAVASVNNKKLKELFPNGTYLEGFIRFEPADDTIPSLSIPYVGFYGANWDKAPIIDKSIYDKGARSFYKLTRMAWPLYDPTEDVTYLYSLGVDYHGVADANKIAFSPDGDGLADTIQPMLSFLRNAKNMTIDIYDETGNTKLDSVPLDVYGEDIRKNFFDLDGPMFHSESAWAWDGKVAGAEPEEGKYIYRIKTVIDYPGANWQTLDFPVRIDLTDPVISDVKYDQKAHTLTVNAHDGNYPIFFYELYEVIDDELVFVEDSGNGVFDLDSVLDPGEHKLVTVVYDLAMNYVFTDEVVVDAIPAVPTGFSVQAGDHKADLQWNANQENDLAGYNVYMNGNKINETPVKTNSYTATQLTNGIPYKFSVTAVDLKGNESEKTTEIEVTPLGVAITPNPTPGPIITPPINSTQPGNTSETPVGKVTTTTNADGTVSAALEVSSEVVTKQLEDTAKANVTLDVTSVDLSKVNELALNIDKATADKLLASGKGLTINNGGLDITIPANALADFIGEKGFTLTIKVEKAGKDSTVTVQTVTKSTLASSVLTIGEAGKQLKQPITITLKADSSLVTDVRKLGAYMKNTDGKWVFVGSVANRKGSELTLTTNTLGSFAVVEYHVTFDDIANHWAKDAIEVLASNRVLNGKSETNFDAEGKVTRAEFAAMLVRTLGLNTEAYEGLFSDVADGQWYTGAVEAAAKAGIVKGANGQFRPNDHITREEMVVMLVRALGMEDQASEAEPTFSDSASISAWAHGAVGLAQAKGYVTGMGDNQFAPKANSKRAEAATILFRLLQSQRRL